MTSLEMTNTSKMTAKLDRDTGIYEVDLSIVYRGMTGKVCVIDNVTNDVVYHDVLVVSKKDTYRDTDVVAIENLVTLLVCEAGFARIKASKLKIKLTVECLSSDTRTTRIVPLVNDYAEKLKTTVKFNQQSGTRNRASMHMKENPEEIKQINRPKLAVVR